jgi:hypothetical protein
MASPRKTYTNEDVERGLMALAAASGSSREAVRLLKAQKHPPIPEATLRSWTQRHAARYDEIRTKELPRLRKKMAADLEESISETHRVAQLALEQVEKDLKLGLVKDPAKAYKELALSFGILSDKARLMRGEPTQIIAASNGDDVLARLAKFKHLLPDVIDGTATEIRTPPALPRADAS